MSAFKALFGEDVLFNAALYVANRLPADQCRMHKIFKTLWFADLAHLKKYGRTITGDTYIAMNYGPVPSIIYDEMKNPASKLFHQYDKGSEKGFITPKFPANEDYLSETDIEELNKSIEACKDKNFAELKDKSHGHAWTAAGLNNSIRLSEILDEIGADAELRRYIKENDAIGAQS